MIALVALLLAAPGTYALDPPHTFVVFSAQDKIVELEAQIEAFRGLSTSWAFDQAGRARSKS